MTTNARNKAEKKERQSCNQAGARTFLSAATQGGRRAREILTGVRSSDIPADRNVRAPLLRLGAFALRVVVVLALLLGGGSGTVFGKPAKGPEPVLLVVMDPLSKELACACVKGYGQRDYRKVAARLGNAIKQR